MSSLFVKCQHCNQRPATIKCSQCKPPQIFRLCYNCDNQVHNRQGPVDQQHKTEIIPYQEMYQKAGAHKEHVQQGKAEPKPKPQFQASMTGQQQQQASIKFGGQVGKKNDQLPTKEVSKGFTKNTKEGQVSKETNFSGQRSTNKARYDQREEEYNTSSQKNSDQKVNQNNLLSQLKEEQEMNQQLRWDLNQMKDTLSNISKDFEKKLQNSTKELEKKINDLKKESNDEKKKNQQLGEDIKKLSNQLKQADNQTQKKLDQQRKQYEQQLEQMEQVIHEKQSQIDEITQEFQAYNLEEVQAKMEELNNDNNMKDQLIQELQNQLQQKQLGIGEDGEIINEGEGTEEYLQCNKDELIQKLVERDQEIKKLEELIDNFKQLYQHMQDEKQVLMDENEKMNNENNQFREIFSQNLHLFGIDPNQLEEGAEDGEDGEEYHQEEDN